MSTSLLEELKLDIWNPALTAAAQAAATDALEAGRILYLPRLEFALLPHEERFLSAEWSDGQTRNINLRGGERKLRGARGGADDLVLMQAMMERFSSQCATLIGALLPRYVPHLTLASTSFRPCEVAGRKSSYRKDDARLHTDAFPSNPTGGARVLRVFANINPQGKPRAWRVGEPFADMAARFLPRARRAWPGEARPPPWRAASRCSFPWAPASWSPSPRRPRGPRAACSAISPCPWRSGCTASFSSPGSRGRSRSCSPRAWCRSTAGWDTSIPGNGFLRWAAPPAWSPD